MPDSLSSTIDVAPMRRASRGTRGKATSTCSLRARTPYSGGSIWISEANIPTRFDATKKNATANTKSHLVLIASLKVKDSTPQAPSAFVVRARVAHTSVDAPNNTATAEIISRMDGSRFKEDRPKDPTGRCGAT